MKQKNHYFQLLKIVERLLNKVIEGRRNIGIQAEQMKKKLFISNHQSQLKDPG